MLLASGLWLAALAWVRPLSSPDETRYTDISRWMAESSDWLIPRINGLPFVHKPPLYFWMEAALIKVVGLSAFSARVPSLCAALLICLCVYKLVRTFDGESAARWSLAALVFNPLFYAGAQYADLDMLVASLITASLCCALLAAHCEPGQARREFALWLAAYAAAGLGVLAKGLIGAVLPGGIFVTYAVFSGRWSLLWRALSVPGLAVFAALVVPWFVAMERRLPGFAHHFFIFQHFTRYTGNGFNNPHGAWFYPAILFAGMLPWTVATLPVWRDLARKWPRLSTLEVAALSWLAVVVVFFSIPASKIIGYIFPALPAFAILVGPWVASRTHRFATLGVGACVCVLGVAAAAYFQPRGTLPAVQQVRAQIAKTDIVVFHGDYYFDAALALDRRSPIYVVANWSRASAEMRDNVARQLTEGREFEPPSGYVLIDEAAFKALAQASLGVWVVVRHRADAKPPAFEGFSTVATAKGATVLLKH